MICLLFAGTHEYFKIQRNIVPTISVLLSILTGFVPGIIIYIILIIIMPADPQNPDLLGFLKSFSESQKTSQQPHQRSRRTLTNVEEKDIKRNGRS